MLDNLLMMMMMMMIRITTIKLSLDNREEASKKKNSFPEERPWRESLRGLGEMDEKWWNQ